MFVEEVQGDVCCGFVSSQNPCSSRKLFELCITLNCHNNQFDGKSTEEHTILERLKDKSIERFKDKIVTNPLHYIFYKENCELYKLKD